MEDNQLKLRFSYTDEFNQVNEVNKTFTIDILDTYDGETMTFLVDQFKEFLLGAGFHHQLVETIQIV